MREATRAITRQARGAIRGTQTLDEAYDVPDPRASSTEASYSGATALEIGGGAPFLRRNSHNVQEGNFRKALEEIKSLDAIDSIPSILRVL